MSHRRLFSHHIYKMQEAGLIDRLSVKWWGFKLEADKAELDRGLQGGDSIDI